jgi:hypothetical protein
MSGRVVERPRDRAADRLGRRVTTVARDAVIAGFVAVVKFAALIAFG